MKKRLMAPAASLAQRVMRRLLSATTITFGIMLAMPANAEDVTIQLTVRVDIVSDTWNVLGGAVSAGDTMTATYTYPSDTPDSYPHISSEGIYSFPSNALEVTAGTLTFQSAPAAGYSLGVYNDTLAGVSTVSDIYDLTSWTNAPLANGTPYYIRWRSVDSSATMFSSDALPTDAPQIVPPGGAFMVSGYNAGSEFAITGSVIATACCTCGAACQLSTDMAHGTQNFSFTGGDQTFTVPSGATFVDVDMWGAGGELGTADLGGLDCEWMPGGGGGYVSVRIYTTPGEQLTVRVGGAASNTTGGWPNGGNGYLDAIRMGRRTYVFGLYGGGGGSSSILRNGTVIAEVGGGNGGLPCLLPIGGGYYEWPEPCNPVGNQRGTDWIGTGEAGGGGYCGGGPGKPSRSGAHYGFTPAQANGQVPGAVEHPLREGAGEGGFWASPTPGRVIISWVASPEPPPVTDATVTGTWDNTATLTQCGYGCGTYVGYVYHFPLVLQQDTATTFLGTYDQVPIVGSITGNAITFGWTGYQTSLGPSDGTCTGTVSGATMSFTCSEWIAGQLNGASTNIALRTGP